MTWVICFNLATSVLNLIGSILVIRGPCNLRRAARSLIGMTEGGPVR